MTIQRNLTGTGLPGLAATAITGTVGDTLTATGSTQSDALAITNDISIFSTVGLGSGCILPLGAENDQYSIVNNGANALKIYPPVGGTIAGGAVNTAYSLAATASVSFTLSNYNTIITTPGTSASSSGGTVIVANGKTFTVDNSLELAGTDGTKMTFPTTNATLARTDAGQTFTGAQIITGNLAIASAAATATTLQINQSVTGATTGFGARSRGAAQSDVTTAYYGFGTFLTTAAASFTLVSMYHYGALQNTLGAGSAVTNQYGFFADGSLTSGTNNYGFYSNITAATGRWGFFAAGTANNALAGNSTFGSTNAPTAKIHAAAGSATASTAPFKYTSGTVLTTPEDGAKEYDGSNEYLTVGSTRYTLAKVLTATAVLDFPNTSAGTSSDLTITVTGAADGDCVTIGVPNAATVANCLYTGFVSSSNTVTVRFQNGNLVSAANPASGTFRATVIKA